MWMLTFAAVSVALLGLLAWSCFRPVLVSFGGWDDTDNEPRMSIGFGYHRFQEAPILQSGRSGNVFVVYPTYGVISVNLPGGCYIAGWDLQ